MIISLPVTWVKFLSVDFPLKVRLSIAHNSKQFGDKKQEKITIHIKRMLEPKNEADVASFLMI